MEACLSKVCISCKQLLPFEEFGNASNNKNGKKGSCKECSRKRLKAWCQKNRDYYNRRQREYRERRRQEGNPVKGRYIQSIWWAMVSRCHNPKDKWFKDYGGRGIVVCDRWRNSSADFESDMGPRPTSKHSIDRIDNDGNYEPGNCRWATEFQQKRNTRKTVMLTYGGITMCQLDWAKKVGMSNAALIRRLRRMSVEMALTIPPKRTKVQR
jgi:hypothetical protein